VVEPRVKPLAYAIILLRREGYPCVFQADYHGAEYEDYGRDGNRHRIVMPSHRTNDAGWGEFRCNGGSVSVWVEDGFRRRFDGSSALAQGPPSSGTRKARR
jgi:hypothetical protein